MRLSSPPPLLVCSKHVESTGGDLPRNLSKAVPEGDGPIPHQDEFGPGQSTVLADVYRLFKERFDRQLKLMKSHFDQQDKTLE